MGLHGGGQVVSVLNFKSDVPSLNTTEVDKKENLQKSPIFIGKV